MSNQSYNNLQARNKQVLANISLLQQQEKKLYQNLNDVSIPISQKQQIINKINEISQIRLNLYQLMNDTYSSYYENVDMLSGTLKQEFLALKVIENELNQSKLKINQIQTQKNNKLRLVEINTYYSQRYKAHSWVMRTIILTCIPLILLTILYNWGFLSGRWLGFLSGIIVIIAVIIIGRELIDMSNRDNMNWNEYNWYFDKTSAPSYNTNSSDVNNPWPSMGITCIGSACCYEGSTYDNTENICIPNNIYNANKKEAFMTNDNMEGLDKYGNVQIPSVTIDDAVTPVLSTLSSYD